MKKVIWIIFFLSIPLLSFSHSWRTDSRWGHNCRTWACAWTYHYHNWWTVKKTYTPPKPVVCTLSQCKLWNTCYNKPANAYCATNWYDAWLCSTWYVESWWKCVVEVKEVTCRSNQCKIDDTCYDKPSNAYCLTRLKYNQAWTCNAWYEEKSWRCELPSKEENCSSSQCKQDWKCYDKPANASCSKLAWVAWTCNSWYELSWWSCIKLTAPKEYEEYNEPLSVPIDSSQNNPPVQSDSSWGTAALLTLMWYLWYKNRKKIL